MRLGDMDRAFLVDVASVNWLHHFVTAASLLRAGAERTADSEHPILDSIAERHNVPENRTFFGRGQVEVDEQLVAQVQALTMLRIFQERIAAMETLGTLLVALGQRVSVGVAYAHYTLKPGRIGRRYREIVESPGDPFWRAIGWPSVEDVRTCGDSELVARCERLYPKLQGWISDVASVYAKPRELSLGRLGHPCAGYDPRGSVFVVLYPEGYWKAGRELDWELLIKAYNMVKHGFNATAVFQTYEQAAASGETAIVLEVKKANVDVQESCKQIDLLGVTCRELARMTLEFDAHDLLA